MAFDLDTVDTAAIIAGNFPFQVNKEVMEKLVSITNPYVPSDGSAIVDNVTFDVDGINNVAPVNSSTPTRSGLATIKVTIKNYLDKDGNPVLEGTGG